MLPVDVQKRLYAAVLSDVLDGMGFRSQAMRPFVRPLDEAQILEVTGLPPAPPLSDRPIAEPKSKPRASARSQEER